MNNLSSRTKPRLFSKKFEGLKVRPAEILNRPVLIKDFEIVESPRNKGKKLAGIQVRAAGVNSLLLTESYSLIDTLMQADRANLPFCTKMVKKRDGYYYFVKLNEQEKAALAAIDTPF